jgi:signal transduction histidine kinase
MCSVRLASVLRAASVRLAALYAGLFAGLALTLIAVISWTSLDALRQQIEAGVERELASLDESEGRVGADRLAAVITERMAGRGNIFYLLQGPDGTRYAGDLPTMTPRAGWRELPAPQGAVSDEGADDEDHRLLARGIVRPDGRFLLVAADADPLAEAREAILGASAWGVSISLVLAIAGGAIVSARFLRRIEAINRTARAIIDGRLSDRVLLRGTGDEFDRLAQNINAMLDQIQALMESLRQVSTDIAHDLRSPLSRLLHRLEAAQVRSRSVEAYRAAVDQAIAETNAILGTFAALLRIAQIEAGTRRAAFAQVDLSEIFGRVADAYVAVAEDRGQSLTAAIAPGLAIGGDRELLAQMLANLVENAITHTPSGTRIRIELARPGGTITGRVADDGPGVPPEARQKIFQRFYRLEASRTTPGSGLGLALVAAIAELHRIALEVGDNQPGLAVVLRFPTGDDPSGSRNIRPSSLAATAMLPTEPGCVGIASMPPALRSLSDLSRLETFEGVKKSTTYARGPRMLSARAGCRATGSAMARADSRSPGAVRS